VACGAWHHDGMGARIDRQASRLAARLERPIAALTRATGATVRAAQRRVGSLGARRKGIGDFVTDVDVRTERSLRRALVRLLPEAGFLGEETDPHDLDRELLWVVDPIDGTSNFASGLAHFAVSVALLCRGQPILAALWAEPAGLLFTARLGAGARHDGRRLRCPPGAIDDSGMIGCQWFRGQGDLRFVAALQRGGSRVRTFGSTVTQLLDVAQGRLDANVQEQGRIWDFAAAGLVVTESGGRFTTWNGANVFPIRDLAVTHTATIASPRNIHRTLCRWLAGRLR